MRGRRRPRRGTSMWHWMKHFSAWVRGESRRLPRLAGLRCAYERAGLVVPDEPVPWCAESVLVEASVHLPFLTGRRKDDFSLCLPGRAPVAAEQLRKVEGEAHRVVFRLPPPGADTTAEVCFCGQPLG